MLSSAPMPTEVRLLAFAGARDVIGAREMTLALSAPCSASALLDVICAQYPALSAYRVCLRVAINGEYAALSDLVRPGDEVALIPPVAGG